MINGQRIFITGGGGFIGSHLCERLAPSNELIVFDNGYRDALHHSAVAEHPNLQLVRGDVLQPQQVAAAMTGCDLIIHMAGIAGIDSVVRKPIQTMQVNLLGALHVLEAAMRCLPDIRRLVLFSTSEVYGPYVYRAAEDGLTTQGAVGEPRWTYAISKLATEHLGFCYQDAYGLPLTTVRPFNIYGPRQVGEGAIHKFCVNALRNEDLHVTGDGNQIRAWCYVDDFVDGILAILEDDKAIGHVFNLGNPKQTATILALAETVIRLAASSSRIIFTKHRMADVEVRVPSIQRAGEILGFDPKINLEEGIRQTLDWYQKYGV